jgi:hypothetical protein
MEDAVVEEFHDCEFQDATEGYPGDDDLDQGEEVPLRPLTPGANPLVSIFLYDRVIHNVVLFWTSAFVFSEVVLPRRLRSPRPRRSAVSSWRRG